VVTKCPQCGTDNPSDSKYCKECAAPLHPQVISATQTLETPTEELTRGSIFAGRYEIIEKLGKGGMGSVYRVEDTKIKQEVALKMIKPEIARDKKTIERFRNELKIARTIRHKNVCGMYDLGESEGTHFITMEYVRGEDLKSFIHRSGKLAVGTAVRIAEQVCEGLSEAHKLGVVHCDLKPSNIMIDSEGSARIMDFGIARSLREEGVTGAGVVVGTPRYMSPEQLEGRDVDQGSDIYSFGIILHEMATGRVPPEGAAPFVVGVKHKDLDRIISKCLEKEKEKRYRDAGEILSELKNIEVDKSASAKIPEWKNSIVVLPFKNMSADPEQEYFCEGMAEEIINTLAHIKDLRVVARTSAFAFKGKDIDIREIGRMLGVDSVLEGSVRKAGNRLRITAQLIDVRDGYHLWSERYDRDLEDIFAIQDEIALAIVENLKLNLLGGEKTALLKRPTDDPEAYNLYLKGLYFVFKPDLESLQKALDYFREALDKDPGLASAYAGIALGYVQMSSMDLALPIEVMPRAKAALQKALQMDENLAEAHFLEAMIAYSYDWDWDAAEKSFKRIFALNPGHSWAHAWNGWFCVAMQRFDEAVKEIKLAQKLDPLMPLFTAFSVHMHAAAGKYDEAIDEFRKATEMAPNLGIAYFHVGWVYLYKGELDTAVAMFQKSKELGVSPGWAESVVAIIHIRRGEKKKAVQIFDELVEMRKRSYASTWGMAAICAALDDFDRAFDFFDKAYEERDTLMPFTQLFIDTTNPAIKNDPRYKELLKRMKLG
jgi:TolB-like protein/tRNA A-37 threonylcarbamoyl transferase component Bud32